VVNVSQWSPTRYYKVDDVRSAPKTEKVTAFIPPAATDRWPKPRLVFESGTIARLNKISMGALQDGFGPESDAWIDQEVTVGCESTDVAGRPIDVIVVRPLEGDSSIAAGVERRARYKAKASAPPPEMNDEIEF
jgi:hypothetical protein